MLRMRALAAAGARHYKFPIDIPGGSRSPDLRRRRQLQARAVVGLGGAGTGTEMALQSPNAGRTPGGRM